MPSTYRIQLPHCGCQPKKTRPGKYVYLLSIFQGVNRNMTPDWRYHSVAFLATLMRVQLIKKTKLKLQGVTAGMHPHHIRLGTSKSNKARYQRPIDL